MLSLFLKGARQKLHYRDDIQAGGLKMLGGDPSSRLCCGATSFRSFRLRRRTCRHHRSPTVALSPAGRDPRRGKRGHVNRRHWRSVCSGSPVVML